MDTIFLMNSLDDSSWGEHQPQVIILGHFDGLHKGHVEVIQRALAYGKQHSLPVSLMTFHPHPKSIFGKSGYDRYLTPLGEKVRLLEELGIDRLYVVKFDLEFAHSTAEQFVHAICRLGAKHVVCGYDYRFGYKGSGTAELLRLWGESYYTVDIVEPYDDDHAKISSTRVRTCLGEGDIQQANHLLGRPYTVSGVVVHGEKRGRTIGYPTANVEPAEAYFVPRIGVYAAKVKVRDTMYDSVLSIGLKPTFHNDVLEPIIEAHLFNFNEEIYGERLTIYFIDYLRAEMKFSSVQELIGQIKQDADKARQLLQTISS